MNSAVIHQPYFLPWIGYFAKLVHCNTLIYLDDVLFRDWFYQKRALIKTMHGEDRFITIPVGHNHLKSISEVELLRFKERFVKKSLETIRFSYCKEKHYAQEWNDFKEVFKKIFSEHKSLVKINVALIDYFCAIFGLPAKTLYFSSDFTFGNEFATPTDRLIFLCQKNSIQSIISGGGKSREVHDFEKLRDLGIDIYIQNFKKQYEKVSKKYPQINPAYSIVDNLFRAGRKEITSFINENAFVPEIIFQ